VAEAYGIEARVAATPADIPAALHAFAADSAQPCLLEVGLEVITNVYPKLAFERTFREMEPLAKPLEMERA